MWEIKKLPTRSLKGVKKINAELEKAGYQPATRWEIETIYLNLIQLNDRRLRMIKTDRTQPIIIRIIANNLLNKKTDFRTLEKMLDRAHWTNQPTNINAQITVKENSKSLDKALENAGLLD